MLTLGIKYFVKLITKTIEDNMLMFNGSKYYLILLKQTQFLRLGLEHGPQA